MTTRDIQVDDNSSTIILAQEPSLVQVLVTDSVRQLECRRRHEELANKTAQLFYTTSCRTVTLENKKNIFGHSGI